MPSLAINVSHVSKRYRLGLSQPGSLRELAAGLSRRLWGGAGTPPSHPRQHVLQQAIPDGNAEFWALKDVTFDVEEGEVLGLIGHNGAGKSTLLKVLSRITAPTAGRIEIKGRMASLLEVGTGFHPELTGRENAFLNGAILGMASHEVRDRLDDILGFAELGPFADTPVKRYSSGMYVRLAFAVAAHLTSEIIVVDEVLAVGDHDFQRKCFGKMNALAQSGRTVLLVSHNLAAVQSLCSRSILLERGRIVSSGRTEDIVRRYLDGPSGASSLAKRVDRSGNQRATATSLEVYPKGGRPGTDVRVGEDVVFRIEYLNKTAAPLNRLQIVVGIYDSFGRALTFLQNGPLRYALAAGPGAGAAMCTVPRIPLGPGKYHINVQLFQDRELLDGVENAASFSVAHGDYFGTGELTFTANGGILVAQVWHREDPGAEEAAGEERL